MSTRDWIDETTDGEIDFVPFLEALEAFTARVTAAMVAQKQHVDRLEERVDRLEKQHVQLEHKLTKVLFPPPFRVE